MKGVFSVFPTPPFADTPQSGGRSEFAVVMKGEGRAKAEEGADLSVLMRGL